MGTLFSEFPVRGRMMRKTVSIDPEKCTGCGECAEACSEGAIRMIGGKAVVVNEECCDGLGACLPVCPVGAITIVEKEAPPFRQEALGTVPVMCPGSGVRKVSPGANSELAQWPVQLRLVPASAPFFEDRDLLIA